MRGLVKYFIRYPIVGNTIMVLFFVFGIIAMLSLKTSFFPETPSRTIKIEATYPGASPKEVEEGIILKIEDILKGVTGIERTTSVSNENRGTVTVDVLREYDTDLVLQDVKNNVDRVSSFPTGMEPLRVYKQETSNFAISFAISGPVDLKTLKQIGRQVEDDLRSQAFISKVTVSGFPAEEIEIALNEAVMRKYDLSFEDIAEKVRVGNTDITGGVIKTNAEEMLIRARNKEYYASALLDIVVKTSPDGSLIRLYDIAQVRDTWADNPAREYVNGDPAVIVTIRNTINQDIIEITDYVKGEYLPRFAQRYDLIETNIIRDGSKTLRERRNLLINNGLIGMILVLSLLSLFLHLRLAFWVSLGIPISFMGMFIAGAWSGLSINVISLFGMILVIGILVDDAIVISENIYRHYRMGKKPAKAGLDGTLEVLPAILTAVTTTVIVFSSFYYLDSRLGDIFPTMAFVVIATLVASLVEGVLILPAHISHSKALEDHARFNRVERWWNRISDKLEQGLFYIRDRSYVPVLEFSLKNKALALSVAFFFLLGSVGMVAGGFVKTTFFPFIEQDNINVTLELPAGTRSYITKGYLDELANAAWAANDSLKPLNQDRPVIDKVRLIVGPQTYAGRLVVGLTSAKERELNSNAISNAIRQQAGDIPQAEKLAFTVASIFGKPISVALLSNNLEELEAAKKKLKAKLRANPDVKDVIDNQKTGLRELIIDLKKKAYVLGLNEGIILNQVRSAFFGREIQRLQRGTDEVKVWVRYDLANRHTISQLENFRIRLGNNREYPLHQLATIRQKRGLIAINHLEGSREIRVEADLASPDVSAAEINENIRNTYLPEILAQHPSIRTSFEGQVRESRKGQNSIQAVIPVILLVMFSLVVVTFRSFWQTFMVFFLVMVFGITGVILGHFIHGVQLSLFSVLGIIALIGVMLNDCLVLVSAMNTNIKQDGMGFYDALVEAGKSRFRPILLTSITTIAGLGPLILENSIQAQFLIPMAIALAYGLGVATVYMTVILPVLLMLLNQGKVHLHWLWTGEKPHPDEMEPAYQEKNKEVDFDE